MENLISRLCSSFLEIFLRRSFQIKTSPDEGSHFQQHSRFVKSTLREKKFKWKTTLFISAEALTIKQSNTTSRTGLVEYLLCWPKSVLSHGITIDVVHFRFDVEEQKAF